MKKIIKNILDFFGKETFDKSESNLENVIEFLKENRPNIIVPEKFKNNLKYRLENFSLSDIKQKQIFFNTIFMPVLSLFFVLGGFFYFYSDFVIINENKDINYIDLENVKTFNLDLVIDEDDNITLDDSIDISKESIKNNSNIRRKTQENKVVIIKKELKKENRIEQPKIELKEEISDSKEEKVINNEIIDILGEDVNRNDLEEYNGGYTTETNYDLELDSNLGEEQAEPSTVKNLDYINTFEEYCLEYESQIILDSDDDYCVIEGKACLRSNYKNNYCKLIEKK